MISRTPHTNGAQQSAQKVGTSARNGSAPTLTPDLALDGRTSSIHSLTGTVAVLGLGYVGLPTAVALATNGFRVLGIDTSVARLDAIAHGHVDLSEADRKRLGAELRDGHLQLTSQPAMLERADIVLVCVPTPVDEELRPDYRLLRCACDTVVAHARRGQTFVLTSTAHVGSTRELMVTPLEERGFSVGEEVFVCFSPERINPGVPEHTQATTPRVIGGYTSQCVERAAPALAYTYLSLHPVSSLEAAEMTKLYENTFRAVNIALAFEMADACEHFGVNPIEVTTAAATKPYAFMAHYPSAGVGGHCIGVDPYYLLWPLRAQGRPMLMTERALELVSSRPHWVTEQALSLLSEELGSAHGARVLVVGASYKPGVADIREAPALKIIAGLERAGVEVSYFDPLIPSLEAAGQHHEHIRDPHAGDYDLVVLATIHPGVDYTWLDNCGHVLDYTYRYAFTRFEPGPGMGGHCLPVDPFYLTWKAREYDTATEFIELAGKVNQQMPNYCVERIERVLNNAGKPVKGTRIAIFGVADKAGTTDVRESPAIKIIDLLRKRGADLVYHDPYVPNLNGELTSESFDVAARADLAVIATAHPDVDYHSLLDQVPLVVGLRGHNRKYTTGDTALESPQPPVMGTKGK